MKIVPATEYTLEELADAYNQTRIDYIVPMPMNVARLRKYVEIYDVDLDRSCTAVDGNEIIGIGMLGVRPHGGWITRLGVLPSGRRQGTGRYIMEYLLERADESCLPEMWLEVIKGNSPAHALFRSLGFVEVDELIVARRPPAYNAAPATAEERAIIRNVKTLSHEGALELLAERNGHKAWTNQQASLENVANLAALVVETADGGHGWVTYEPSLLRLTRIIVQVVDGEPARMTEIVLNTLHRFHPTQDAIAENFSAHDPQWPGFLAAGYFDAFRRIEMIRK